MAAGGPRKIDISESKSIYTFDYDAKQIKKLDLGGFSWEFKFSKRSSGVLEKKEKENTEIVVKGSGTVIDLCNSISEQLKKLNAVLQMSEQSKEQLYNMLVVESRNLSCRYSNTASIAIASLMGQINPSNSITNEERQEKTSKM